MALDDLRATVLAFAGALVLLALACGGSLLLLDGGGTSSRPRLARTAPECLEPTACRRPSAELLAAYGDARACDGTGKRICLVPMGDVAKDLVDHLVDYYRREYDLDLRVLRPLTLQPGFDPGHPGQLEASKLWGLMRAAYPAYAQDRSVVLIGLTPVDMYLATTPQWHWAFGQAYRLGNEPAFRHGVISYFRMDPSNYGLRPDTEKRNQRLRKMMNKYVAITYYGMRMSSDPKSVLYDDIGGLDDLDRMNERIPLPR
ncbi:MAG TPA: hypothetical protein VNN21_02830 [Dehalococcoidia bacterium]|nr:hypothetical protein [Dehalococcoidia bacterium]